ncbi:DNA translocase FtsK [Pseudomonas syringae]|uniref:DNA segregation ATPase FtsK/SpoIIIE-like protein n=1 Tax=Pseudomonas syringae pv. solidagae TaxID=264458 RepID=A0A0P9Z1P8_PSESX|nr:DNA translocase FtsK [Pseudomonas syringae]KPY52823.1 DNA segregation ATPase FtsK/SpoIIIE -like protein [Pseudomonas syringae pv. solidagae]RMT29869.1 DNA segregation ATPase FtsK/SpoIIIE -like protein [Pseudomonas syringae pv. solidagae]RMT48352.1 DNA segregation ATPase FtsK/SpoIIIE -like protein [Pseudomonas syringae pv. solidagae]
MKMEHKDIIDRARMHGVLPSELAHELLVHDLVNAAMFELTNIHSPYSKLNQGQQQEVIDRITDKAKEAAHTAVAIIASRNVITIPCKMKQIQVTEKTLTVTSLVDAKDPARHGLTDSAGHLCLLVLAPDDYEEGLDFIRPDRDQSELPLHASDLTGNLFDRGTGPDEGAKTDYTPLADPFYDKALTFVLSTRRATASSIQRALDIGFTRAAALLDKMEQAGVVSPIDHTGDRVVLLNPAGEQKLSVVDADLPDDVVDASFDPDSKEFGDYTYEDASQLVVLHATTVDVAWLQRRLAIDSDQATTLLLRLVDNNVIELETEAEQSIDNTYKVIAELGSLCVE